MGVGEGPVAVVGARGQACSAGDARQHDRSDRLGTVGVDQGRTEVETGSQPSRPADRLRRPVTTELVLLGVVVAITAVLVVSSPT